jgi:CubicO group peptidase (beta-lactamase class C family)
MADESKVGGLSAQRLEQLRAAIAEDISRGLYRGATILVSRNGQVGLHESLGHHRSDDPRPIEKSSVFSLFSLTKGFTNVLVFRAIERGQLALTTKVSSVIPEFSGKPREDITVVDLLTHRSGLPGVFTPRPGMNIDVLSEIIEAICKYVHSVEAPGVRVDYSPMASHALLGEMVRRTDPKRRSFRQILSEEILEPLGLRETSLGVRADLKSRHVTPEFPAHFPATHPGHSNLGPHGALLEENSEMPWVGMISTATDVFRFAEMLRRGGELDGKRIVGPRILDMATRNWTGDHPNQLYKGLALSRGWRPFPAYLGLGFTLRGDVICQHQFGTLASPRTFGSHGAGSTVFWVDPESSVTFVCLTAGLIDEADNILRFQRLSDIAHAAVL